MFLDINGLFSVNMCYKNGILYMRNVKWWKVLCVRVVSVFTLPKPASQRVTSWLKTLNEPRSSTLVTFNCTYWIN